MDSFCSLQASLRGHTINKSNKWLRGGQKPNIATLTFPLWTTCDPLSYHSGQAPSCPPGRIAPRLLAVGRCWKTSLFPVSNTRLGFVLNERLRFVSNARSCLSRDASFVGIKATMYGRCRAVGRSRIKIRRLPPRPPPKKNPACRSSVQS